MNTTDDKLTLAQAGQLVNLGRHQLRRMILRGDLTGYQPSGPNGRYLVSRAEVEQLLEPLQPREAR